MISLHGIYVFMQPERSSVECLELVVTLVAKHLIILL
jgi:hypothetical protein